MKSIKRILVANRGEIALRIIRTAREMGIETVAIYSDADRTAPHVIHADFACNVGAPPSIESYLNQELILSKAKEFEVDAIHPGYGFLSENASFAQKVEQHGIKFIGPSSYSIELMGNKIAAKNAVKAFDIPLIPGTEKALKNAAEAKTIADSIGYPVLIKASAGGGGKGMRVVESSSDLNEQFERAVSEAESAFGDGSVFIEKFITSPRHIEFQILADQHGNIIHLFERECSIQRRHQKVIEEAPSVVLTPELRQEMGNAAINVAKAAKYEGAGTIEFIMDENKNFYFLEMNTRLQVEHPVTELICGMDLVKEQIQIAEGKTLSKKQEDLKIKGHAIELRVYAEDAENNFLPSIGKLQTYQPPKGPGVRVDDGYYEKMDIPIHYDSMISKLVTYGENREKATVRLIRAISEYQIIGVQTTLPFGTYALQHEDFVSGNFDTNFIEKNYNTRDLSKSKKHHELAAIAAAFFHKKSNFGKSLIELKRSNGKNKWKNRIGI